MTGRIVLLNGVPRSGKTSIARALQTRGNWMVFGVDAMMAMTPQHLQPGIGLRPGGEKPELEEFVQRSYGGLFQSLAALARNSLDVVSDVGLHDSYSRPLNILETARETLTGLPVLWVGVRCPIDVIMARRNADPEGGYYEAGDTVPPPVQRWQDTVHAGKRYDLEVDTSVMTPERSAERIEAAFHKFP